MTAAEQTPDTEGHEYVTCTDRQCARPHFIGAKYVDPDLQAALSATAPGSQVAPATEHSCDNCDGIDPGSRFFSPPQTLATDSEREALRDRLAEALGDDTFVCGRVWEAWSYRTMTADDFTLVYESDRLDDLVAAVDPLLALLAEQAATIERLTADAQQTDWQAAARSILALGSQRTEGQG